MHIESDNCNILFGKFKKMICPSFQDPFHLIAKYLERKVKTLQTIVLTMIGISNSNKTRYQVGCQSRTNACI